MSNPPEWRMRPGEQTSAAASYNAGKALKDQHRYLEAAERFFQSLSFDPADADAAYMLANSLRELGCLDEALVAYDAAIALRPDSPDVLTNKGVVLRRLGRVGEATSHFREAVARGPQMAEAHWNLALALLLTGSEEEGWKEYEWRWSLPTFPNYGRPPSAPRWDGRVDRTATVLLRAEQGFGDAIQFVRFVPLVAGRCSAVVVECPAELTRLFGTVDGAAAVIESGKPLPPHDVECPFMSLPSLPGLTPGQQSWRVPYLHPGRGDAGRWDDLLGERRGRCVGILWGGRIGPGTDGERSIALEQLLPLANLPGIVWVSLQQGPARSQREGLPWEMIETESVLGDFADTAELLDRLDLVISVDSAYAHLAGALGTPVWTLLPFAADWRWGMGTDRTPWYPTMRLFRQSVRGDWGTVVEELATALRDHGVEARGRSPQDRLAVDRGASVMIDNGIHAYDTGDYTSAERWFREAAVVDERSPVAWFNLANALACQNRHDAAIGSYTKAMSLAPGHHAILHNFGVSLASVHRCDESVRLISEAVALFPSSPDYHNSLGNAFANAGDHDRAIACYTSAMQLAPNVPDFQYNIGEELLKLWRLKEAIAAYRHALGLDETFLPAYHNLGYALLCDRRVDEAIEVYEKGLALSPSDAELRWNLAQALLVKGEYACGWRMYEDRWQTSQFRERRREFPFPAWDGSPLTGKTILLYSEQGFGDAIQFVRYAGVLASTGATVVVECPSELSRLFRNAAGVSRIVPTGSPPGACDFACAIMSLPAMLGTTLETIPSGVPYLDVDLPLLEKWRGRMDQAGNGFRVGLVWSGRTQRWNEHHRAVSLEDLRPLFEVGGISIFSLQTGDASMELGQGSFPVVDLTAELEDFADTAAMILNLDLVIGVDTAVVHLTGALGKPVWTLLPYAPDWRWLTERQDSPWYPTMTLFRQEAVAEVAPVVAAVREQLARVARRRPIARPRPSTLSPELSKLIARGIERHTKGDSAGAWNLYGQALEGGAADAGLCANVGLLHTQAGREVEAGEWYAKALRMDPDNAAALNNLALQKVREGSSAEARRLFQRALRSDPGNASLMNNIGITLAAEQITGGEISWFRNSVRIDRGQVDGHWNLAQAALSHGLLEEGWREYEWRWRKPDFTSLRKDLEMPPWDGSPLSGRSLLVHAEQGFGDTVQFCRYLSHPRLAGGDVVVEVPRELVSLMRRSFDRIAVVARGESVPRADLQVPLMSLPYVVGTTLESIPAKVPYLKADPDAIARWEARLGGFGRPMRIGVVWRGRPTQRLDRKRSLPLQAMRDLFGIEGAKWYSLQLGPASEELRGLQHGREGIRDISEGLVDFAETAAALTGLDLLVSVDTAVAHLAGALGRPAWVLLSTPADWRWMRLRTDSPWYPSMELFRQAEPGEWAGVVRRVAERLRENLNSGMKGE